ncbi:cupredoxin domain-containing protein [Alteromonas aestuariivivens]|uniref:Cupredoxin domain-containing protein n=1 Tax=Alteromonas aestuariivivens TaxID=1938339 RepID=A0A3D8MAQ0_9ALTE|nr:cupredoxin domain-containing protein [Alteromonas aestuariivivens]RDV26768.1 cupredoxin domain-containing protein [Alteromonas aestuariivivens]
MIRINALLCLIFGLTAASAWALPETVIEIRNHLFIPQRVTIPANTKVKIIFVNHDDTPEEIDSFDLNREKVVLGHSRATIFVGPLPPGEYQFFGEYHPNTAVGIVEVTDIVEGSNAD